MQDYFNDQSESDESYEYEHLDVIEYLLREDREDNENIEQNQDKESKKDKRFNLVRRRIDSTRIRHKTASNLEIHTSKCRNVKLNENDPIRSGAIIYTRQKGVTYFCMGIDYSHGDLTDFAGGVKKGETVLQGGLRELAEESMGIFNFSEDEILDNLAFYSNNMLIMFIYLDVNMEESREKFLEKISIHREDVVGEFKIKSDPEVSDIMWLKKEEFIDSINGKGKRIYSRVRKILSKVTDVIQQL